MFSNLTIQYCCIRCTLILSISSIFFSSCNEKPPHVLTQEKDVHINFPEQKENIWSHSNYILLENGHEYLACISSKTKNINIINIENNVDEYTIPLTTIDSIFDFTHYHPKFYIHNLDSIFILPDESKTLILINRKGNQLNKWSINLNYKYDYVLSGFNSSPIFYYKNRIYVRFVPKVSPFRQRTEYFKYLPEIAINIKNTDDYINRTGGWPEKYLKENYYDDYPSRCIIDNDNSETEVYSFAADHDIYIYNNGTLIKKASAKSDSIENFEKYADDSIGNIAYTMKYLITAPRYGMIYYDKYRKLFFRIAFHKTNYVNKDGTTIKRSLDQPWSIIVLNEKFEKISELNFDPSIFAYGPIYIIKDGLLISKRKPENITDENYSRNFVLFKVNL